MFFEHMCFISYPHLGKNNYLFAFIEKLKTELEGHFFGLSTRNWDDPVAIDIESIRASDNIDMRVLEMICKSICYIVIYVPTYIDGKHTYCARELVTIKKHQEQRLANLNSTLKTKSLIIPIILMKGKDTKIPEVIQNCKHYDLSMKYICNSKGGLFRQNDDLEFSSLVYEIATKIVEWYELFLDQYEDLESCFCNQTFPSNEDQEVIEIIQKYSNPKKFPQFNINATKI